jgi:hypothetical protein
MTQYDTVVMPATDGEPDSGDSEARPPDARPPDARPPDARPPDARPDDVTLSQTDPLPDPPHADHGFVAPF